jgi:hypothetical protein
MIARGFKSVICVATVGGAALGCYMVSLRVATERADLAKVERQIVAAKRDIRSLQTELGTRGRMTQLEDWNSNVLALSAPSPAQFVPDAFALARLERHDATVQERSAEVKMASMETGQAAPAANPAPAPAPTQPQQQPALRVVRALAPPQAPPRTDILHRASYSPSLDVPRPVASPTPAKMKPAKPEAADAKAPAVTHAKAKPAKPAVTADADGDKPVAAAHAKAKPKPLLAAGNLEPKAAAAPAHAKVKVKPILATEDAPRPTHAKPKLAAVKPAARYAGRQLAAATTHGDKKQGSVADR